jgi:hypothetical protein
MSFDKHSSLTDRMMRSAYAFRFGDRGGSRMTWTPSRARNFLGVRRDAAQADSAGREVEDVVRDRSRPAPRLNREEVARRDGWPMGLDEYRRRDAPAAGRDL